VDEVGRDSTRFMMLYRKNDAPLDFDFMKVTEQSRDNPVFYVQYAHARTCSVLRNAAGAMPGLGLAPDELSRAPLERLSDEQEIALIRRIAQYPRIVDGAAEAHEPHRIAFYLYELASDFHALWNRGKDLPQLRFINETDRDLSAARLALVRSVGAIIASGLSILGVEPVKEMR